MATQKKVSDSAEAALSAIEEALSQSINGGAAEMSTDKDLDLLADAKTRSARPDAPTSAEIPVKSSNYEQASRRDKPASERMRNDDGPRSLPGQPANDDRRAVGEILQALQSRPSRRPYALAALASAAWLALSAYGAWSLSETIPSGDTAIFGQSLSVIAPYLTFACALPVIMMFSLAFAAIRAHQGFKGELRKAGQRMPVNE